MKRIPCAIVIAILDFDNVLALTLGFRDLCSVVHHFYQNR